jgi:hypothetical protein
MPGMDGEPDAPQAPKTLPGPSSAKLIVYGSILMPFGALPVIPIGFESDVGSAENWWGAGWLSVALLVVGWAGVLSWRGYRRRGAEIEAGYTTSNAVYVKNPDLFLCDARTLEVVLAPTVAWRSLGDARLVAGFRHQATYLPDESRRAVPRNLDAVAHEYARQHHLPIVARPGDEAPVRPASEQ